MCIPPCPAPTHMHIIAYGFSMHAHEVVVAGSGCTPRPTIRNAGVYALPLVQYITLHPHPPHAVAEMRNIMHVYLSCMPLDMYSLLSTTSCTHACIQCNIATQTNICITTAYVPCPCNTAMHYAHTCHVQTVGLSCKTMFGHPHDKSSTVQVAT